MKTSDATESVKVSVCSEPAPPQVPVLADAVVRVVNRPPGVETVVEPGHATQAPQPSSIIESQSSSTVLQASVGGLHAPKLHVPSHTCVPVLPQPVVHVPLDPGAQTNPSSI